MGTDTRKHVRKPEPTTFLDKARVYIAKLIAGPFWTDPRRRTPRRQPEPPGVPLFEPEDTEPQS